MESFAKLYNLAHLKSGVEKSVRVDRGERLRPTGSVLDVETSATAKCLRPTLSETDPQ
jgi:hypothetical protein